MTLNLQQVNNYNSKPQPITVGTLQLNVPKDPEMIDVTPAMAQKMLQYNSINRNYSDHKAEEYSRYMKNGTFCGATTLIIHNTNGAIENGQHTLNAIVKSGVTLKCLVWTGAPIGTGDFVDVGKSRTLSDAVTMQYKRQGIPQTHISEITADCEKLFTGLSPKVQKRSLSEKINYVLAHRQSFNPLISIFVKNKAKTVGKTSKRVGHAVFRAAFEYFMTDYYVKQGIKNSDVINLAEDWLLGKCTGNHPLNKFTLWYEKYSKNVEQSQATIDTFRVYSMLGRAIELVLVEGKQGVKSFEGWKKEAQFGTTLSGIPPHYPW